jgi:hypothetical protein
MRSPYLIFLLSLTSALSFNVRAETHSILDVAGTYVGKASHDEQDYSEPCTVTFNFDPQTSTVSFKMQHPALASPFSIEGLSLDEMDSNGEFGGYRFSLPNSTWDSEKSGSFWINSDKPLLDSFRLFDTKGIFQASVWTSCLELARSTK